MVVEMGATNLALPPPPPRPPVGSERRGGAFVDNTYLHPPPVSVAGKGDAAGPRKAAASWGA